MKRIDLFMPPLNSYGVLHYFTKRIHEALIRAGIHARLLEAKRNEPGPFLNALFSDRPECTLSFNGLLPDDQGRFFSDLVRIPHITYLVDAPGNFLPLIQNKSGIIACADQTSLDVFKGLGFSKTLFLPLAADPLIETDVHHDRPYDVVMFASYIDHGSIRNSWKKKFSASLCRAMNNAVDIALADLTVPFFHAFAKAVDNEVSRQNSNLDPGKIDFVLVLEEIEQVISGKDRAELIKAIRDAKVDIFGSADSITGWKKFLGRKPNVTIHDPVPFEQAVEIMQSAKILLNSSPWISGGAHERIFTGAICGALIITNGNHFLTKQFQDGESMVFYQPSRWDKANHRINEYLSDANKRENVAMKGIEVVKKGHTWDHRVRQLIKELPPLLSSLS